MDTNAIYHGGFGFMGVKATDKYLSLYTIGPKPQKIRVPVNNITQLIDELQAAKSKLLETHPHLVPAKAKTLEEILGD